jgi:ketosteroid isomerase-like protein
VNPGHEGGGLDSTARPDVREFFERYERASRNLDADVLTRCFADQFLSLDSSSAHALTPPALMAALPRRKALFESIGSDGLELNELAETRLDDDHTLVRTSWMLRRRGGESPHPPIMLKSTFVLRREQGGWRIVLYLNHQDMGMLFGAVATGC